MSSNEDLHYTSLGVVVDEEFHIFTNVFGDRLHHDDGVSYIRLGNLEGALNGIRLHAAKYMEEAGHRKDDEWRDWSILVSIAYDEAKSAEPQHAYLTMEDGTEHMVTDTNPRPVFRIAARVTANLQSVPAPEDGA